MVDFFKILSADKELELACTKWTPNSSPVATLQINHGMLEDMTRYSEFAEYMCQHGIVVYGHDCRGHGQTSPNSLGFFAEKNGDELLVDDLYCVTERIMEDYPNIPHFVLGHSMGSLILRRYITKYGNKISGAIFLGTAHPSNLSLKWGRVLDSWLITIHGPKYVSKFALGMLFSKFEINLFFAGKAGWMTRDKEEVKEYSNNPNFDYSFTLSAIRDLLDLNIKLKRRESFENIPRDLPTIFISGGDDPVGDYGRGVTKAYHDLSEYVDDNSMILYGKARHELIKETNRDVIFKDVLTWINNKMVNH